MRIFSGVLLVLIATTVGAAFFFGMCTIAAERDDKTHVIQPDFMIRGGESTTSHFGEQRLEATGKIANVNPTKNQFTLTQNIKNLTFRVANDTMIVINGQSARLTDLNGGDDATVIYTKEGQQLFANVVRCTRKAATE